MIFHLLGWALLGLLALLWTGAVALLRAVLGWDGWAQGGNWSEAVAKFEPPPWLADLMGLDWIAQARVSLEQWGPQLQGWLSGMPLGQWADTGLTVVWVLGLALLLLIGLAGSAGLVILKRGRAALQNRRP